jgi:lipid A disaccharide synthetase
MKYYLIAGERSGDLHASNLIKYLKKEDPDFEFRGIGGDYMSDQGTELIIHYKDLAVMGFLEVLKNVYHQKIPFLVPTGYQRVSARCDYFHRFRRF